jgi:hypothetical protein
MKPTSTAEWLAHCKEIRTALKEAFKEGVAAGDDCMDSSEINECWQVSAAKQVNAHFREMLKD